MSFWECSTCGGIPGVTGCACAVHRANPHTPEPCEEARESESDSEKTAIMLELLTECKLTRDSDRATKWDIAEMLQRQSKENQRFYWKTVVIHAWLASIVIAVLVLR